MTHTGEGGNAETDGESTVQFVIEEIENVLLTVIEELRERPMVAAALGAVVLGAWIGVALAGRRRSKPKPKPSRAAASVVETLAPLAFAVGRSRLRGKAAAAADEAARTTRSAAKGRRFGGLGVGSSADLVNLGVRLLQNPIVRGYLLSMVGSRLRRARR